jgi:AcrR family transcriptional regulator
MSIGDVAREAGTTRPTVYRRWRTKEELATAAIGDLIVRDAVEPTGETYQDLLRVLEAMYQALIVERRATLFGGIFTEADHNPVFVQLFQERILRPRQEQIVRLLRDGQKHGQVRADLDMPVLVSLVMGTIPAMYMNGEDIPSAWPHRVMKALWPSITTTD